MGSLIPSLVLTSLLKAVSWVWFGLILSVWLLPLYPLSQVNKIVDLSRTPSLCEERLTFSHCRVVIPVVL